MASLQHLVHSKNVRGQEMEGVRTVRYPRNGGAKVSGRLLLEFRGLRKRCMGAP
ncbi:hypothetical protein MYCTH_2301228 [Thermothelomyces thermophilus ATCC 42464]|uniref:Uncharacterized protein n=1 Tax=Thermothelomyces thermophilus (strain ATCC 42464 / BCRC 31852 / DSM 1799) TaxID=573729 RepID=G2Q9C1_THET4|nr:uncharacterized protein MYCTH_2301228 [Thermothelomyces thermophilus ATCC 42464]AEO56380.1 hypothetical protein MYCTH_2301228 [Thermothelomyces thermophilus ATCC 42464]